MFKILTTSAFAIFAASLAQAGTLTEPEVEQAVETAAAAGSGGSLLIPLLLLGAIAIVATKSDGEDHSEECD